MAKYNPFLMIGSWVGAVIGLILAIISSQLNQQAEWVYNLLTPTRMLFNFANLGGTVGGALFTIIIWTIINIILGFLIGWGIHALIRKLR